MKKSKKISKRPGIRMRRLISLLILLALFNIGAAEEIKFKDIESKHWAEDAVDQLVKSGVTSGYPDNTFRGKKKMTRQEMAIFISNLLKNKKDHSDLEKLLAELKAEGEELKYKDENPITPKLSGNFTNEILYGNAAIKGIKLNYRLNLSLFEKLGQTASIKINFDTNDIGYGGTLNNFAPQMLDFEGLFKINDFDLKTTIGPGTMIHRETDGVNPVDDLRVIARPKTGILVKTYFQSLGLSLGYTAHTLSNFGEPAASEVFLKIESQERSLPLFGKTTVSVIPRAFFNSTQKDLMAEVVLGFSPSPAINCELLIGASKPQKSGYFARGTVGINTQSTKIKFAFSKAGQEYRTAVSRLALLYLNEFNKMIADGSIDAGLSLSQKISKNFELQAKCDAVLSSDLKLGKDHSGTTFTSEIGLSLLIKNESKIYAYYKTFCAPSGLNSIDPSLAVQTAELSDVLGMEVSLNI